MPKHFPGLKEEPIPGEELTLGTTTFVVPPLLARDMRKALLDGVFDRAMSAAQRVTPETIDAIFTLCLASLKRNYPAITQDDLEEVLDAGNMNELVNAVFKVNRLTSRPTTPAEAGNGKAILPPTSADESSGHVTRLN